MVPKFHIILHSSSGGTTTTTVNFKSAKLSLEVIPQITPEGSGADGVGCVKEDQITQGSSSCESGSVVVFEPAN